MANDRTMQAQRYLEEYRQLLLRREALLTERDRLREGYLRAGGNPDDPAPGEEAVSEIVDHIGEAIAVRLALLEQLPGERQKLVLTFRYINGWDWNEICRRLCYGESQIFRLHREALAELTRLMKVSP
jgi:DNA-directed RNA polymerase specialized sigma subunit